MARPGGQGPGGGLAEQDHPSEAPWSLDTLRRRVRVFWAGAVGVPPPEMVSDAGS